MLKIFPHIQKLSQDSSAADSSAADNSAADSSAADSSAADSSAAGATNSQTDATSFSLSLTNNANTSPLVCKYLLFHSDHIISAIFQN